VAGGDRAVAGLLIAHAVGVGVFLQRVAVPRVAVETLPPA